MSKQRALQRRGTAEWTPKLARSRGPRMADVLGRDEDDPELRDLRDPERAERKARVDAMRAAGPEMRRALLDQRDAWQYSLGTIERHEPPYDDKTYDREREWITSDLPPRDELAANIRKIMISDAPDAMAAQTVESDRNPAIRAWMAQQGRVAGISPFTAFPGGRTAPAAGFGPAEIDSAPPAASDPALMYDEGDGDKEMGSGRPRLGRRGQLRGGGPRPVKSIPGVARRGTPEYAALRAAGKTDGDIQMLNHAAEVAALAAGTATVHPDVAFTEAHKNDPANVAAARINKYNYKAGEKWQHDKELHRQFKDGDAGVGVVKGILGAAGNLVGLIPGLGSTVAGEVLTNAAGGMTQYADPGARPQYLDANILKQPGGVDRILASLDEEGNLR